MRGGTPVLPHLLFATVALILVACGPAATPTLAARPSPTPTPTATPTPTEALSEREINVGRYFGVPEEIMWRFRSF